MGAPSPHMRNHLRVLGVHRRLVVGITASLLCATALSSADLSMLSALMQSKQSATQPIVGNLIKVAHNRVQPTSPAYRRQYLAAVNAANKLPAFGLPTASGSGLSVMGIGSGPATQTWQYVGPNNLDVSHFAPIYGAGAAAYHYGPGPVSGKVNAVAFDPTIAGTIYVGSATGGLWKSTTNGTSWTNLSSGWLFQNVSCIAVPQSNVIYVGTGDYQGLAAYAYGIMKSTNGGASWTVLGTDASGNSIFGSAAISKILVDHTNPLKILVTTGRGASVADAGYVWISQDGGASWTQAAGVPADSWSGAAQGPDGATMIVGSLGAKTYKSTDGWVTWSSVTTNATVAAPVQTLDIAASPTTAGLFYLYDLWDGVVKKTIDTGSNWTTFYSTTPVTSPLTGPTDKNWLYGFTDFTIQAFPGSGHDQVLFGLKDLIINTDGTTWTSLANAMSTSTPARFHDGQHCVALNPNDPTEMLIGNDGGVYRLKSGTVTSLNFGLPIAQIQSASWHPTDATRILAGAVNNSSPVALGDLANWKSVGSGNGGSTAINPATPTTQFASDDDGAIYATNNSWTSYFLGHPGTAGGYQTLFYEDPSDPNTVYLGTNTNSLYRVNPLTGGSVYLIGFNAAITCIAIGKSDPNVLYVGLLDGSIYLCRNKAAGTGWSEVDPGNPGFPPGAPVTAISPDPSDPYDIIVGLGASSDYYLYRCRRVLSNPRMYAPLTAIPTFAVNCIERDPIHPVTSWYVGTTYGVFATQDAGVTYSNVTKPLGLPYMQVTALKYNGNTGILNAATYGRGIWKLQVGSAFSGILAPQSLTLEAGTLQKGNLSSILTMDSIYYQVQSVASGSNQVATYDTTFQAPIGQYIYGVKFTTRMLAPSGTSVNVRLYDWTAGAYVTVGTIRPSGSFDQVTLNVLNLGPYISSTGLVQAQIATLRSGTKIKYSVLVDSESITTR